MSHGSPVPSLTAILEGDVLVQRAAPGGVGPVPSVNAPNAGAVTPAGHLWTMRTSSVDNDWAGVCYGNGVFVAVAGTGTGNRVMTSSDGGVTWTTRTSAADNNWKSVCFGNGLFVAVSTSGTGNRVMTSSDGVSWTSRTSAADNNWVSVCFGNGQFVAVSTTGTGNRVMTSSDGVTWTSRASAADYLWQCVGYGAGRFVALNASGNTSSMTSVDGITWSLGTVPDTSSWRSIAFGNGVFVSVTDFASTKSVMTSSDGLSWTLRDPVGSPTATFTLVAYGNGLFVAGKASSTFMSSSDGINWTQRLVPVGNAWRALAYGNGVFVTVSDSGAGNRVASSGNDAATVLSQGLADSGALLTVPTNGGSATIPDRVMAYILDPAAGIAGFTLTMPANPFHGQIIALVGGSFAITTLTLNANSGQTFATGAAISTLAASAFARYVYSRSNTKWYRLG